MLKNSPSRVVIIKFPNMEAWNKFPLTRQSGYQLIENSRSVTPRIRIMSKVESRVGGFALRPIDGHEQAQACVADDECVKQSPHFVRSIRVNRKFTKYAEPAPPVHRMFTEITDVSHSVAKVPSRSGSAGAAEDEKPPFSDDVRRNTGG